MPNWDRYCVECGFTGSYLDFEPSGAAIEDQHCYQLAVGEQCGGDVAWTED